MWTVWFILLIIVGVTYVIVYNIYDYPKDGTVEQIIKWRKRQAFVEGVGIFLMLLVVFPFLYGIWYICGGWLCWESDMFGGGLREDLSIWDILLPIIVFAAIFPAIVGIFLKK